MTTSNPLQETIQTSVARISEYLAANKQATSWQLKVKFGLSASVLYLSLGLLLAQGKITLEADGINYVVTWGQKSAESVAPPTPFKEQM